LDPVYGKALTLLISTCTNFSLSRKILFRERGKERKRKREREKERKREREREKTRKEWRVGSFAFAFGSVNIQSHIIKLRTNDDFRGKKHFFLYIDHNSSEKLDNQYF
jgi:hypothetical protein